MAAALRSRLAVSSKSREEAEPTPAAAPSAAPAAPHRRPAPAGPTPPAIDIPPPCSHNVPCGCALWVRQPAAKKAAPESVKACCAALRKEATTAADKSLYTTAAGTCDAIEKLVAAGTTKKPRRSPSFERVSRGKLPAGLRLKFADDLATHDLRVAKPRCHRDQELHEEDAHRRRLSPAAGRFARRPTRLVGCKKKERRDAPGAFGCAPPPAPAPVPTPVVIAPEEDAGAPVDDAGGDAKKPAGKAAPADVAGLRACCTALQQNASSMPPPNNAYALQAAYTVHVAREQLGRGYHHESGCSRRDWRRS